MRIFTSSVIAAAVVLGFLSSHATAAKATLPLNPKSCTCAGGFIGCNTVPGIGAHFVALSKSSCQAVKNKTK
jgi:hypothetical protein